MTAIVAKKMKEYTEVVPNAGSYDGKLYTLQCSRSEVWHSGATGSWNARGNEKTGRQCVCEWMDKRKGAGALSSAVGEAATLGKASSALSMLPCLGSRAATSPASTLAQERALL